MYKYIIIGTGSKANSYLIEDNNYSFLVDMGYSYRELKKRAEDNGYKLDKLKAIFITHTHSDHCSMSLNTLLNKHKNVCVYTHKKNLQNIKNKVKDPSRILDINLLNNSFEDFTFKYLETTHDAVQTIALKFTKDNKTLTIATDLGCVTPFLYSFVEDSDILAIESNYDQYMLENGFYEYYLKQRIKGDGGHLSNIDCKNVVKHWISTTQSKNPILYCVHLSENNNDPSIVEKEIKQVMNKGKFVVCKHNMLYKGIDNEED